MNTNDYYNTLIKNKLHKDPQLVSILEKIEKKRLLIKDINSQNNNNEEEEKNYQENASNKFLVDVNNFIVNFDHWNYNKCITSPNNSNINNTIILENSNNTNNINNLITVTKNKPKRGRKPNNYFIVKPLNKQEPINTTTNESIERIADDNYDKLKKDFQLLYKPKISYSTSYKMGLFEYVTKHKVVKLERYTLEYNKKENEVYYYKNKILEIKDINTDPNPYTDNSSNKRIKLYAKDINARKNDTFSCSCRVCGLDFVFERSNKICIVLDKKVSGCKFNE